jgi:peptidoglycan hydrolase CwlO-like protein
MYQDEIFENALKTTKESQFNELKGEVKTVERVIERLLTQLLECSSSLAERDFNVCGV